MKTNRGLLLTVTVAIGGFLQGCVFFLLLGHQWYMKEELNVEIEPKRDLLLLAVPYISMLLSMALFSSKIGTSIARRPLLVKMSVLYLFCSVVMLWSGNIPLLLVARFLDGFTWGFSFVLVSCYFMEFAPWSLWRLCLFPFTAFCGNCLFLLVDRMQLSDWLIWRILFWVAFILSLVYFTLVAFYLPESPQWLVSKGRNDEASQVLQTLHGRKDVSDEMHILVHGHRLEGTTSTEDDDLEYGPQNVSSENFNKPVTLSSASEQGSIEIQNTISGKVNGDSLTRGDDFKSNA